MGVRSGQFWLATWKLSGKRHNSGNRFLDSACSGFWGNQVHQEQWGIVNGEFPQFFFYVLVVTLKSDWVLSNVSCFTVQVDFQIFIFHVDFSN